MGTNKLLVSILGMDHTNGKYWQKSSCFNSTANDMRSYTDNMVIPDLVTVFSTEILLDATTAYVEATEIKKEVFACIYDLSNISGISFLNGGGGLVKTPSSILDNNRTKNLVFIKLSCTIDATSVDDRICQELLYLSFCIKLP